MARAILACIVAGAIALALAVGLYSTHTALADARTQLDEQARSIDALRASQARIQAAVAGVQKLSTKTKADLAAALRANPSFDSAVVPADVADSLCKRLKCANQP